MVLCQHKTAQLRPEVARHTSRQRCNHRPSIRFGLSGSNSDAGAGSKQLWRQDAIVEACCGVWNKLMKVLERSLNDQADLGSSGVWIGQA
jgi:hypothetical protein